MGMGLTALPVLAQTTITTNDGTDGVSGFVQQNDVGSFGGAQWHVKNAGTTTTRKAYIRFDTSGITESVSAASFDLVVSLIASGIGDTDQVINVYGITDETLDNWDPATTTWSNAPANDTGSKFAADLTKADLLGTIVLDFNGDKAAPVGTVVGLSDQALANFLNTDTNGLVTFILGRTVNPRDGDNLLFAGDTHGTLAPPSLSITSGPDEIAPTLVRTSPAHDEPEAPLDTDLVATFDEPVQAGTGNITLHLASDGSEIDSFDVAASGQLDFAGPVLTITPRDLLASGVEYYILIPDTAVQDSAGNTFAGISDPSGWSFTGDGTPPSIVSLNPADDSPGADIRSTLVATFSEEIFGASGNILVKDLTNLNTETFDIFDIGVTISGNTLTIEPTNGLLPETDYAIQIESGAIEDFIGNSFAGITDDTTWNFTTASIVVVNQASARLSDTGGQGDPWDLENTPHTISFDAGADADKLVVTLGSETGSGGPPVITYDGHALTRITGTALGRNMGIWYLDLAGTGYAGGEADLTVDMTSYFTVNGIGLGVVSLDGTAPGVATANGASSRSVPLTTPVPNSFVMTTHAAQGTGNVGVPAGLTVVYRGGIGSAVGGTAYLVGSPLGTATYTYTNSAPNSDRTSAAAFVPASGAPAIVDTHPANGALGVRADANLVATFSENVTAGSGTIEIWQAGGGSPVESFDVATSDRVTVSGRTLTIDPTSDFPTATLEYHVLIGAGAVVDNTGGDPFGGIPDPAAWSFTTFGPPAADNNRISIMVAGSAGEPVTGTDLVHDFDTFPRVATSHTLQSFSDVAMDAGHHLVIYNARFDDPDDANGNRSEIQTNLNLNGADLPAGWSQGYIRRISGQHETICAGGAIIEVATGGDVLQLQSFKTGTANENVTREPGQTALQLVKLDDGWDYLRLAGHDGSGTDQALVAGDTTVAYAEVLEQDAGSFGDISDGVTLVQAGHYLVLANTYMVGDNAGSAKRTAISQHLTLDGSPIIGSKTTVYLRGAAGEDEGAATIGMIIETTAANQVLRTLVARENEAVGVAIHGGRTSLTIAKLPDSAHFIRLTDTGNLQDFNGGILSYDTQAELDAGFTHDTVTNPDQVGVTAPGDYLFFASQYNGAGVIERVYYNQGWQINGTGGLAAHGQTGGYNRVPADTSGAASTVGNWSGFVTSLSASDYVQTVTQALGADGSEAADDLALQGVSVSSLFGDAPSGAYDTWAFANGLGGADALPAADTENGGAGDGLVQLLEFGFGTDPNAFDNTPLAADGTAHGTPLLTPAASGGGFELVFVRRDDHGASGSVTYTPQFSSGDLETFYDDPTAPAPVVDSAVDGAYEIVSVPFPASLPDGQPARFGRVKVEVAP